MKKVWFKNRRRNISYQELTDLALENFTRLADVLENISEKAMEEADAAYEQASNLLKKEEELRALSSNNNETAFKIRKLFT